MTYKEQFKEIENLLNRIKIKTKNFSEIEKNPYFEDLSYVFNELKNIDNFLNDKYLNNFF
jgi:dynactin complex subunit